MNVTMRSVTLLAFLLWFAFEDQTVDPVQKQEDQEQRDANCDQIGRISRKNLMRKSTKPCQK